MAATGARHAVIGQGAQNTQPDAPLDAWTVLPMLDTLRVAITIFGPNGDLRYANAHLGHLFASLPPVEKLGGATYEDLLRLVIAGGEVAPHALADGAQALIDTCLTQLVPGQHAPHDIALAGQRVVEIKARHAPDGSAILLWSDVTQVRAQLAQLEEAVTLSADAFAFYDHCDRLVAANALYARVVGLPLDQTIGYTFEQILAQAARHGSMVMDGNPRGWVKRRLARHTLPVDHGMVKTGDGQTYLVRDRAISDGGRAIVFTDITDRMRAEAALAEQESALERSRAETDRQNAYLADMALRLDQAAQRTEGAKTTLLRTMSHELKTPLNAILGFSDLMVTMAERLSPAQVREYASLIRQGGTNLLKIINQVMDLTKIAAGRYTLNRASIDAGLLVRRLGEDVQDAAALRGMVIDTTQCPSELMVDADEVVLEAMVQGLIDNALIHAGQNCTLTLAVRRKDEKVVVDVADNGRGVAAHDLPRIQKPFEHGGTSSSAQHTRGAGLGLTLIKALAELHAGHLEINSEQGQGFNARLFLPVP